MISSENIVYSNNELKSVLGLPNALATSLFRENATTNQDACWLCKKKPRVQLSFTRNEFEIRFCS